MRRIAHIEIALAERGKNGAGDLATVVGEDKPVKAVSAKPKGKAKKKAVAKKFSGKKTAGKR